MKRVAWLVGLLLIVAAIALLDNHPAPVSAGGWPCFLCHGGSHGGFDVVGTDLAPALAGSKLTDEQIIAQVRKPRGVMPAFSAQELPDQVLKDGFINVFVRGKPSGQPTATLNPQTRSMALATMAAVAATRSVESARLTGSVAIETSTPTPSPIVSSTKSDSGSAFFVVLIGGLIALSGGVFWIQRAR